MFQCWLNKYFIPNFKGPWTQRGRRPGWLAKSFETAKSLLISCVFNLMGLSEAFGCRGGSSSFHVTQSFYADYQLVPKLFKIRTKEIYVEISYTVAWSKPKELLHQPKDQLSNYHRRGLSQRAPPRDKEPIDNDECWEQEKKSSPGISPPIGYSIPTINTKQTQQGVWVCIPEREKEKKDCDFKEEQRDGYIRGMEGGQRMKKMM